MSSGSKKVIYAALIANILIAVSKFIATAFTGSSAMLSEGIHSLVDTGNQVLTLYGIKQSKKPPDDDFPFGHGKEIYFWSFVVAILIFALGAGVSIYEGVHRLYSPTQLENPVINYVVLCIAFVFEGISWSLALKEFSRSKGNLGYIKAVHRSKDPSIFIVFFEDTAALLGIIAAFGGVLLSQITGNLYYDSAASIIIGMILGVTAMFLAYETKGLLIGESADKKVVAGIKELSETFSDIEHVNEVLTMHMGPDFILANISVDFVDTATAFDVECAVAALDKKIKERFPRVKRIFIEAEARPTTFFQSDSSDSHGKNLGDDSK